MTSIASRSEKRPAIFIACDGVITERTGEPPSHQWIPGAIEGLGVLARLHAPVILLAQEPASVREMLGALPLRRSLHVVRARTPLASGVFTQKAAHMAATRHIVNAARRLGIDLSSSVVIGDSWTVTTAALELGCQPVMVMTGQGRQQLILPQLAHIRAATWFASDLATAALSIETLFSQSAVDQPVA